MHWDAGDEHFAPHELPDLEPPQRHGCDQRYSGTAGSDVQLPACAMSPRSTSLRERASAPCSTVTACSTRSNGRYRRRLASAQRARCAPLSATRSPRSPAPRPSYLPRAEPPDGRFFAAAGSEVIELGPVNASIHQVNEHVRSPISSRSPRCYLTSWSDCSLPRDQGDYPFRESARRAPPSVQRPQRSRGRDEGHQHPERHALSK